MGLRWRRWPRGLDDRHSKRIEHVLKNVAGFDHFDHPVTTHLLADHFGGIEGLSKFVGIDYFWDSGLPDPNASDGDRAAFSFARTRQPVTPRIRILP
jgi:beta-lactamase superfamily II metal-dependent hydrolase